MTDVVIIGAGPAGISAAIYAIRYGLSVLVFEQLVSGGQIALTAEIENYPAIENVTGYEFALNLHNHAVKLGVKFSSEKVVAIENLGDNKVVCTTKNRYDARAVIIATGAKKRKLGCPGEEELSGKGVHYCASCDGFFFKNKAVAVVGGGNNALEDALFLAKICTHVHIIQRESFFEATRPLQQAIKECENVTVLFETQVKNILGGKGVESVSVVSSDSADSSGNKESSLAVSGIFIAIGTVPDNEMFANVVQLDKYGYITADEDCQTGTAGIYVAGDCRVKTLRQIVTATADGAIAAFMASNYINTAE